MDDIESTLSTVAGLGSGDVIFETRIWFRLHPESPRPAESGYPLWNDFTDEARVGDSLRSSGIIFSTIDDGRGMFVLRTQGLQRQFPDVRASHIMMARAFLRTFDEFNGDARARPD